MNELLDRVAASEKWNMFLAMIFLQSCDVLSTVIFSWTGVHEGNRLLSMPNGSPDFAAIAILKFFGLCMSAYLLYFTAPRKLWLFRTLIGLYVAVAIWNVFRAFIQVMQ